VSTSTVDDQLAEVRRRIDHLQARTPGGNPSERARTRRRLDALRREDASTRAAARQAPDEVDGRLARLMTRLDVAERSLTADLADDPAAFAAAVEAELQSWDTYLERLQTTVATQAWNAREQAEAAIVEIRNRRIAVDERLAQAHAGGGRQERRERVTAARDELERKADELSAKLS
jgi:hypothetical protein